MDDISIIEVKDTLKTQWDISFFAVGFAVSLILLGFVIYIILNRKQRQKLVIPEKEIEEERPSEFNNETIAFAEPEEFPFPPFPPPDDLFEPEELEFATHDLLATDVFPLPDDSFEFEEFFNTELAPPDYFAPEIKVSKVISLSDNKQSKPIRIGYEPSITFEQQEPYHYAVAKMPPKNSLIKSPRKGYAYYKGVTEDNFFKLLKKYFQNSFNVYNDRFVPKGSSKPYEPDFVLSCEINNKNIFIDIEIDEPYDIKDRKPIHCIGEDDVRDEFFTKRGWIVIRFAEKQIHQEPHNCCAFVAKVIHSIDKTFYSFLLKESNPLNVPQWTTAQSEKWANENYREMYLNLDFIKYNSNTNEVIEYEIVESIADYEVEEYVSKLNDIIPIVLDDTPPTEKKQYPPSNNKPHYPPTERTMKTYKPNSYFDFGQYKGQKLIDVYKNDSSYIRWCKDNVKFFHISSEDLSYMESLHPKRISTSSGSGGGCMVTIMFIFLFNIFFFLFIIN